MGAHKQQLRFSTPLPHNGGLNETTALLDEGVNTLFPNSAVPGQLAQPAAQGFLQRVKQAVQFVLSGTLPTPTTQTAQTMQTTRTAPSFQPPPSTAYRAGGGGTYGLPRGYAGQAPSSTIPLNGMNYTTRNQMGSFGTMSSM